MRKHSVALIAGLDILEKVWTELNSIEDTLQGAKFARDTVLPQMKACRTESDALEEIIDNRRWPLPSYEEMLWLS